MHVFQNKNLVETKLMNSELHVNELNYCPFLFWYLLYCGTLYMDLLNYDTLINVNGALFFMITELGFAVLQYTIKQN